MEWHLGGSVTPTSSFNSDHDLRVSEFKPHTGLSVVSTEPALDPLSPLSLPLPALCSLSKINIKNKSKWSICKGPEAEAFLSNKKNVIVAGIQRLMTDKSGRKWGLREGQGPDHPGYILF